MTTKDEALKMAGFDLDGVIADGYREGLDNVSLSTIKRVRKTIADYVAQPGQQPVAWMDSEGRFRKDFRTEIIRSISAVNKEIPLYTHPTPSWQELNDDEIEQAILSKNKAGEWWGMCLDIARAIEQALKEKNDVS